MFASRSSSSLRGPRHRAKRRAKCRNLGWQRPAWVANRGRLHPESANRVFRLSKTKENRNSCLYGLFVFRISKQGCLRPRLTGCLKMCLFTAEIGVRSCVLSPRLDNLLCYSMEMFWSCQFRTCTCVIAPRKHHAHYTMQFKQVPETTNSISSRCPRFFTRPPVSVKKTLLWRKTTLLCIFHSTRQRHGHDA